MGSSPRRRLPVMVDVAKVTCVSHQAVSRVLNDHPDVSAEARTQVLRAIDQLGYRRNLVARALVTRNSRRLGVVSGPADRQEAEDRMTLGVLRAFVE